jgi:hypothetical protein
MDFENIYFETNGKVHCKERHHREGAKGMGGRQTQVNQSPKFTKRYYNRTNVGTGSPKAESLFFSMPYFTLGSILSLNNL